jgi:hypothetical protein
MDGTPHAEVAGPRFANRRPEPRWITLADLGVMIAGFAFAITLPSSALQWPFYLPSPPLLFFIVHGCLRLTLGFGLVLALVILSRRARFGGALHPAEWLALVLASFSLQDAVPNLDTTVNAYYAAVGSTALDFGVARWLLSIPPAVGVVLIVAGFIRLRRPVRDGSRIAAAMTVIGIVSALFLWFWGPCEVGRLQLPWLLVPSPPGDPSSWGWRTPVVLALRTMVADAPIAFTAALPAAATVRAWWDRRRGPARARSRSWVWTEPAAIADAVLAPLPLMLVSLQRPVDLLTQITLLVGVGITSWWIAGRLGVGVGREPSPPLPSSTG